MQQEGTAVSSIIRVQEIRHDDGTSAGIFGDGIKRVLVRLPDGRDIWMLSHDLKTLPEVTLR